MRMRKIVCNCVCVLSDGLELLHGETGCRLSPIVMY